MKFYSTNNKNNLVDAKTAVTQGLAPDGGLYMPTEIPKLSEDLLTFNSDSDFKKIALEIAKNFLGQEIESEILERIVTETLNFECPLVKINEKILSLELFHGPTLAFKDFGARFMARVMSHFRKGANKELNILVATSGDTGGAVAHGFLGVPGIKVTLLYPSGQVSRLQEQQFTTLGQNITALEVSGTFDDCQRLVKEAFVDQELKSKLDLSSANSINISRLIPQSFYFFKAAIDAKNTFNKEVSELVFCTPSGNFGNLTAGLLAKRMGLNIGHFIAATNANDIVPTYLETGEFTPRASIQTVSNAMDVGNPSNFARMHELFGGNLQAMRAEITGDRYNDSQTKEAVTRVFAQHEYTLDPHGAVGFLALEKFLKSNSKYTGVLLETAHPSKFVETVEECIKSEVKIPLRLQEAMSKEKKAIKISPNLFELKQLLLN